MIKIILFFLSYAFFQTLQAQILPPKDIERKNYKKVSGEIPVWQRAEGNYFNVEKPKTINQRAVKYSSEKSMIKQITDYQAGNVNYMEIYNLKQSIEKLHKSHYKGTDTVVLHFDNKIRLPLDLQELAKTSKSLYLAIQFGGIHGGNWTTNFPKIQPYRAPAEGQHPIKFSGNKIVALNIIERAILPTKNRENFLFRRVGSLIGIEFMNWKLYRKQFQVRGASEKIFLSHCHFCHAIQKMGAERGGDLLWPKTMMERKKTHLILKKPHLFELYNYADIRDPFFQVHYTKKQIGDLIKWLEAMKKAEGPFAYGNPKL